ncbi:MAG: 4-hydroxy-tetrahydrodipicolinate reductase [Candidatus Hydrogenedentes bacterium]|nr:4-hydroxy-tetrahydrodipicolinate reductase [Candidatus Hydrogenedentota bacterium]MBI3117550.1 4-hydroxy-tetrahydrodipicolinate reductase [Candidatus Hydrogenedentota bacterium]
MKICMAGACGRMGRRILELAAGSEDIEIAGAFDVPENAGTELQVGAESGRPRTVVVGGSSAELEHAEVLIDFTAPASCIDNVRSAAVQRKAAVVGTTGLSTEQLAELQAFAEQSAVVYAPNMSVGVNLLFKLTREVAQILGLDYNVEIVEIHHNQKKDSPSGTAVRLAEQAAAGLGLKYAKHARHGREGLVGARPRQEIGLHAVRGGDVVGEHTVSFIGQGERLELVHKAHSRDNFARGALVAARFAVKAAPGLYDMQDVLGLR